MNGWSSPRLGIRFDMSGEELRIFAPDGTPFRSHEEIEQERKAEQAARQQAEQRATQAEQRAIRAEQERERLLAKLRELGVEPEGLAE
jgi:predicted aconitase